MKRVHPNELLKGAWRWLRRATGDDAYERYLEHHALRHPGKPSLSRADFFSQAQDRKWEGINRCC